MKFETRSGAWQARQFFIDPSPSFAFNLQKYAVWLETARLPEVLMDAADESLLFHTVRKSRNIVHAMASASCLYRIDNQFHLAFLCSFPKALWTNSRETETIYKCGFRVVCGYTCSRGWLFVDFSRARRRQQHIFFPFLFWSTELSRFAAQTGISVRLLWLTGLYNEATHEYGDWISRKQEKTCEKRRTARFAVPRSATPYVKRGFCGLTSKMLMRRCTRLPFVFSLPFPSRMTQCWKVNAVTTQTQV